MHNCPSIQAHEHLEYRPLGHIHLLVMELSTTSGSAADVVVLDLSSYTTPPLRVGSVSLRSRYWVDLERKLDYVQTGVPPGRKHLSK